MRIPYTLPDADCERLRRSEMNAVRMLLALLSSVSYAKDDLRGRLWSACRTGTGASAWHTAS